MKTSKDKLVKCPNFSILLVFINDYTKLGHFLTLNILYINI